MDNTREKLIELIEWFLGGLQLSDIQHPYGYENLADFLIANGVTVQKWIPASKPPTRKDADKYGRILAMELGMMALVDYSGPINYPNRFPYWLPLPEPPRGE